MRAAPHSVPVQLRLDRLTPSDGRSYDRQTPATARDPCHWDRHSSRSSPNTTRACLKLDDPGPSRGAVVADFGKHTGPLNREWLPTPILRERSLQPALEDRARSNRGMLSNVRSWSAHAPKLA